MASKIEKIGSEYELWTYFAKLWGKGKPIVKICGVSRNGLCTCLNMLRSRQCISQAIYVSAYRRLENNKPSPYDAPTWTYWWPQTKAGALKRAALCRRLAKECQPEPKALLRTVGVLLKPKTKKKPNAKNAKRKSRVPARA